MRWYASAISLWLVNDTPTVLFQTPIEGWRAKVP